VGGIYHNRPTGGGFTPTATRRIPFGNGAGTALEDDAGFTWNKTTFTLYGEGANLARLVLAATGTSLEFNATAVTVVTGQAVVGSTSGATLLLLSGSTAIANLGFGTTSVGGGTGILAMGQHVNPSGTPAANVYWQYSIGGKPYFRTAAGGLLRPDVKGADVASATNLAIPAAGKVFRVTGTTTIHGIATANMADFEAGQIIVLYFAAAVTVNHQGASGNAKFKLAGSANLSAAADTTLVLCYDGTDWQEIGRKVA
jgi:hypothetical protein